MSVPETGYMNSQWIHWQAWFPVRCDTLSMYFILHDFLVHETSSMIHFTSHHTTHSPYMLWWVTVWPRCNGAFNTATHCGHLSQYTVESAHPWLCLNKGQTWPHYHALTCDCFLPMCLYNRVVEWLNSCISNIVWTKKVCMILQWRVTCSVFLLLLFIKYFNLSLQRFAGNNFIPCSLNLILEILHSHVLHSVRSTLHGPL